MQAFSPPDELRTLFIDDGARGGGGVGSELILLSCQQSSLANSWQTFLASLAEKFSRLVIFPFEGILPLELKLSLYMSARRV